MTDEQKKSITLSIPILVFRKLARESRRTRESKSAITSYVLKKYFENRSLKDV